MSLGAVKMYSSWKGKDYYVPGGPFEAISYNRSGNGSNGQLIDLGIGFPKELKDLPNFLYDFNGFLNSGRPMDINKTNYVPAVAPIDNTYFYIRKPK